MRMGKTSKIITATDMSQLGATPFLLLNSRSEIERYLKINHLGSDIERNYLSDRIMIPKGIYGEDILTSFPVCMLDKDYSDYPMHESEEAEDLLILQVYDLWLQCLARRRLGTNPVYDNKPLSISIYFDERSKARAWQDFYENNRNRFPAWLTIMFPKVRPMGEAIGRQLGDINIWRHVFLKEVLDNTPPSFLHYEFMSFHNPFFSFLYSVDPLHSPFAALYLVRQIIESALVRIAVIDDRVATALYNKFDTAAELQKLERMGIQIASRIRIGEAQIDLVPESKGAKFAEFCWDRSGREVKAPEIDMLFIHQTIFDDRIAKNIEGYGRSQELWREKWILELKKRTPYVIFHSGRGVQKEKLPGNVSFIEYSVLQQYVLQEPSKFFLTLHGLGSKEG